jgi:hypothetical protein
MSVAHLIRPYRKTLHLAQALLLSTVVAIAAYASDAPPNDKHCWLMLKRNGEARPEFVAVIGDMPNRVQRHKYPHLFTIKWGYEASQNGLPTEAALLQGRTLYKELDQVFGNKAVFALSRTGNGGRTMYYYASSASKQAKALRQYFDAGDAISVSVSVEKQPEWESVQEVLKQVSPPQGKVNGQAGCSSGQ